MPDPMSDPTSGPIAEPTGAGGVGTAAPDVASGDPALWPATRLAAAIRRRELGSEELLDHYLERIERLNPAINAVVTLDAERARAAARGRRPGHGRGRSAAAAARPADHDQGRPGHGGHALDRRRDGAGRATSPRSTPRWSASLRRAGAIVFGKTNLPRWSGDLQSFNALFGTTNNPWDLTRTPGGSSGGAAAAVAAGLTSFEIGTDIGGSIRLPAALLRRLRAQAVLRAGARPRLPRPRPGRHDRGRRQRARPARPLRRGPRAAARPDRRAHPRPGRRLAGRAAAGRATAAWRSTGSRPGWTTRPTPSTRRCTGPSRPRPRRWRTPAPRSTAAPARTSSLAEAAAGRPRADRLGHHAVGRRDPLRPPQRRRRRVPARPPPTGSWAAATGTGWPPTCAGPSCAACWADFFTRYDVLICPVTLLAAPSPTCRTATSPAARCRSAGMPRPYLSMIGWTAARRRRLPAGHGPAGRPHRRTACPSASRSWRPTSRTGRRCTWPASWPASSAGTGCRPWPADRAPRRQLPERRRSRNSREAETRRR